MVSRIRSLPTIAMAALRRRRPALSSEGESGRSLGASPSLKSHVWHARGLLLRMIRFQPEWMLVLHFILIIFSICWRGERVSKGKLSMLLGAVSGTLNAHGVQHWVCEGAQLLYLGGRRVALTPYHRHLTLCTIHGGQLNVAAALSAKTTLASVETHSGLRVYFDTDDDDSEMSTDYGTPFVDIRYYRRDGLLLTSHCCACAAASVAACTKRLCACRACVALSTETFPLDAVRVSGIRLYVPRHLDAVLLNTSAPDIHPSVRHRLSG